MISGRWIVYQILSKTSNYHHLTYTHGELYGIFRHHTTDSHESASPKLKHVK